MYYSIIYYTFSDWNLFFKCHCFRFLIPNCSAMLYEIYKAVCKLSTEYHIRNWSSAYNTVWIIVTYFNSIRVYLVMASNHFVHTDVKQCCDNGSPCSSFFISWQSVALLFNFMTPKLFLYLFVITCNNSFMFFLRIYKREVFFTYSKAFSHLRAQDVFLNQVLFIFP